MEPVLDETTLVPDPSQAPADRIVKFARLLRDLANLGVMPILRSVQDALGRDIGGSRSLSDWCFSLPQADRDAGLLVAGRLSKQPYLDGPAGLLAHVEGEGAIEGRVDDEIVLGLTYAALTDAAVVGLVHDANPSNVAVRVVVARTDGDEVETEEMEIPRMVSSDDLNMWRTWIEERLFVCRDGLDLCCRLDQLFPYLRIGARAREQLEALSGADPKFPQILRHLRALDRGAQEWKIGEHFSPWGSVAYSVESATSLQGRLGKKRDFPAPAGFSRRRWSLHTKLAGGIRLYFDPERSNTGENSFVLVGYLGPHLPTKHHQ